MLPDFETSRTGWWSRISTLCGRRNTILWLKQEPALKKKNVNHTLNDFGLQLVWISDLIIMNCSGKFTVYPFAKTLLTKTYFGNYRQRVIKDHKTRKGCFRTLYMRFVLTISYSVVPKLLNLYFLKILNTNSVHLFASSGSHANTFLSFNGRYHSL